MTTVSERQGCGVCSWCHGADVNMQTITDRCPHGYACCLNCPTCKLDPRPSGESEGR